MELCALHEGTKSECEERYHLVMNKLNTFEMLPKENANEMYSRLNVIVEELNGLGLTQMSTADVARKILCVLPIEKYGHIVSGASSRRSLHRYTNRHIREDQCS